MHALRVNFMDSCSNDIHHIMIIVIDINISTMLRPES